VLCKEHHNAGRFAAITSQNLTVKESAVLPVRVCVRDCFPTVCERGGERLTAVMCFQIHSILFTSIPCWRCRCEYVAVAADGCGYMCFEVFWYFWALCGASIVVAFGMTSVGILRQRQQVSKGGGWSQKGGGVRLLRGWASQSSTPITNTSMKDSERHGA